MGAPNLIISLIRLSLAGFRKKKTHSDVRWKDAWSVIVCQASLEAYLIQFSLHMTTSKKMGVHNQFQETIKQYKQIWACTNEALIRVEPSMTDQQKVNEMIPNE